MNRLLSTIGSSENEPIVDNRTCMSTAREDAQALSEETHLDAAHFDAQERNNYH